MSEDQRAVYERPERGEPGHCPAVLLAESAEQIQAVLEIANAEQLPLVLSAGRTGLVEAQRPEGECVLSLERMRRVNYFECADGARCDLSSFSSPEKAADRLLEWWTANGRPELDGSTVSVQAGLPIDALNLVLASVGRMFPMEMGSSASASVGASIANASAGANAICYGTAAHMASRVDGFWADASTASCDAMPSWQTPQTSTLAIDSTALPEDWGLAGSQGAFGVVTQALVTTHAVPGTREAVLLPADSMAQAMSILKAARSEFGGDIEEFEFMSLASVQLVQRHRGAALRLPFDLPPTAPYLLLLQIKSDQADDALAERLYGFCAGTLEFDDDWIGYAPIEALKAIRHSITECSNLETRALGAGRLSFDTATPIDVFGQYLDQLSRSVTESRPDAQLIAFGHAGVGGAHLHLIGGAGRPLAEDASALVDLVFDVTQSAGGTFSAEHGVGPKWGAQFRKRMSSARLQQLDARKQKHDPRRILSPRSFGFDRLTGPGR